MDTLHTQIHTSNFDFFCAMLAKHELVCTSVLNSR